MMYEYIERDAVLAKGAPIPGCFCNMISAFDVVNLPAADVAPVAHGRWEEIRDPYGMLTGWIHKECGREVKCADNYCPSCGAKMDMKE